MASYLSHLPAMILSFEFLLGGQARLTSLLTPSLHAKAMRKASGTAEALYPIIPVKDPTRNTNIVGLGMVITGLLWANPAFRGKWWVLAMSEFWTGAGIYSQHRMKIPYWLPLVNSFLGLVVFWTSRRDGRM